MTPETELKETIARIVRRRMKRRGRRRTRIGRSWPSRSAALGGWKTMIEDAAALTGREENIVVSRRAVLCSARITAWWRRA